MRKNFITREYTTTPISGVKCMKEQKTFFGSKILEIEDEMYIGNTNIVWTESNDNTQGIKLEDIFQSFNTFDYKKNNHTIKISDNQTDTERKEYTMYDIKINIRELVKSYLFAQLKTNRAFENISNSITYTNNVNDSIYEYITQNIYPRISFNNIILYVKYYKIGQTQGILDSNNEEIIAYQYDNLFREDLITIVPINGESQAEYLKRTDEYKNSIRVKNFYISTDLNQDYANIIYKQTQTSQEYKFDYYFDVIWNKA